MSDSSRFARKQIFVGGGILAQMDSEDQLATVLGHEVERIPLNQCREQLIKVLAEKPTESQPSVGERVLSCTSRLRKNSVMAELAGG